MKRLVFSFAGETRECFELAQRVKVIFRMIADGDLSREEFTANAGTTKLANDARDKGLRVISPPWFAELFR